MEHTHGMKPQSLTPLPKVSVDGADNKAYVVGHYDRLTQLPNYYELEHILTRELNRAKRHKSKLALLFIDLDNFKHINTSLGYPIGDKVLLQFSQHLIFSLRHEDIVARPTHMHHIVSRLSDDEFVVVLTHLKHDIDAAFYAKRLLSIFSKPIKIDNTYAYVNLSIGIAVKDDMDMEATELINNASIAMHRAKKSKDSKIEFFTRKLSVDYKRRTKLENGLREALEKKYFYLVYQPQYQLKTGKIRSVEALLRWRHPEFGLVPPDEFIPIAEKAHLIHDIGDVVLKLACQQYRQWQENGIILKDVKLSINISPYQLKQENFLTSLCQILGATDVDPHHLEFEITETAFMTELESSQLILHKLQQLGISLAIDDFGKGQSSLSRIVDLPVHILKIDKSFVLNIQRSKNAAVIVKSIIALGEALGLMVVAEGIETEDQLNYLIANHCAVGQGYFYTKGVNADKVTKLLRLDKENRALRMKAV